MARTSTPPASSGMEGGEQLCLPLTGVVVPTAGEEMRHITLGDRIVPYLLRRSARRSVGFSIDHRGLRIGAPRRTSLAEVETLIRRHHAWIVSKLDEWRGRRRPELLRVADGMRIPCMGSEIEIRLAMATHRGTNRAIWTPETLTLCLKANASPGEFLEKALRERAREHFAERMPPLAKLLKVSVPPMALSSARTRWGSCSASSGIRLNWRLIHFPEAVIDYVVIHELAHLRHMDHSRRFWSLVETGCPDYRARRSELQRLAACVPYW